MEPQHSNPQTEEYARKRIEESPFHNLMRELRESASPSQSSDSEPGETNANS